MVYRRFVEISSREKETVRGEKWILMTRIAHNRDGAPMVQSVTNPPGRSVEELMQTEGMTDLIYQAQEILKKFISAHPSGRISMLKTAHEARWERNPEGYISYVSERTVTAQIKVYTSAHITCEVYFYMRR